MNETHGLNLTTHRAPASVWDRRGWDGTREQLATTRWLLGVGGGALALQGLRQRSVMGSVLAGIGGSPAWGGVTGGGWRRGGRWGARCSPASAAAWRGGRSPARAISPTRAAGSAKSPNAPAGVV